MASRQHQVIAGLAVLAAVACIVALSTVSRDGVSAEETELLLKSHLRAHEPYSPPSNLYLWWGDTTNHRAPSSGEHLRHLLSMGNIEGGEWRDPMFLGNNGVATFRSQRFRRISESCCSTIVMPPFEWDFPVYNTHKVIGQRLRNYVANGNMLILSGGLMEIEFINTYFFYNVEPADGNYSPGPFKMLPDVPEAMKGCPKVLPQKGISVTAVKKGSIPSGGEVLWGTPHSSAVFMIKFCEAQSPQQGMPPVKVLPRDCPASEKLGRPCSCGHIMYVGYNFRDPYPSRYDHVVRAAVEILNPSSDINLNKAEAAKGKASSKKAGTQSLSASASAAAGGTSSLDQEAAAANAATASSVASARGVDQKIALQKMEIAHLEGTLGTLENERRAVHQFTSKKEIAPGRTVQLDELRDKARHLISEIKAEERGKRRGDGDDSERRSGDSIGQGEEHLILESVAALAQDVRQIDAKVNRLSSNGDGDDGRRGERRGERRDDEAERGRRGERRGERGRDEGRHSRRRHGEGSRREEQTAMLARVKEQERKKVAAYKKRIESVNKELAFEQSIPSPEYAEGGEEEGHTRPFSAKKAHCGTLCKLKKLVIKTRGTISAELDKAMD